MAAVSPVPDGYLAQGVVVEGRGARRALSSESQTLCMFFLLQLHREQSHIQHGDHRGLPAVRIRHDFQIQNIGKDFGIKKPSCGKWILSAYSCLELFISGWEEPNLQGTFAVAIAPKLLVFLQPPQGRSEVVQLLPLTVFGLELGTKCTPGCANTRISLSEILRQDFSEIL